jgi:DNA gyrase/topoisomerase IV subunit A
MSDETDAVAMRREILVGLLTGLANGRDILAIVQEAEHSAAALAVLRQRRFVMPEEVQVVLGAASRDDFLTETQAQAVLNNRLNRFTPVERHRLLEELAHLVARIKQADAG